MQRRQPECPDSDTVLLAIMKKCKESGNLSLSICAADGDHGMGLVDSHSICGGEVREVFLELLPT